MLQKITMIEVKMSSRGQKMCLGLTFFESPCISMFILFLQELMQSLVERLETDEPESAGQSSMLNNF